MNKKEALIEACKRGHNEPLTESEMEEVADELLEEIKPEPIKGGICKITNDKFSWVLEVDGKTITFNGSDNADYFAELYAKLGYEIIWNRDKWKED